MPYDNLCMIDVHTRRHVYKPSELTSQARNQQLPVVRLITSRIDVRPTDPATCSGRLFLCLSLIPQLLAPGVHYPNHGQETLINVSSTGLCHRPGRDNEVGSWNTPAPEQRLLDISFLKSLLVSPLIEKQSTEIMLLLMRITCYSRNTQRGPQTVHLNRFITSECERQGQRRHKGPLFASSNRST